MRTAKITFLLISFLAISLLFTCVKKEVISLPEVTTDTVINITLSSATLQGTLLFSG